MPYQYYCPVFSIALFFPLLELESRLAVRLDNEEVRLTNRVTASRNMTLSAFEARLS